MHTGRNPHFRRRAACTYALDSPSVELVLSMPSLIGTVGRGRTSTAQALYQMSSNLLLHSKMPNVRLGNPQVRMHGAPTLDYLFRK